MSQLNSRGRASRKNHFPVSLNHTLDHKLLGYTAAASASGIGILALAQPSLAEIVYTPTHETIAPNSSLAIDLNNDGITDFTVHNSVYSETFSVHGKFWRQTLIVNGEQGNGAQTVSGGGGVFYAAALMRGVAVGPQATFGGSELMDRCNFGTSFPTTNGQWFGRKNSYLGLEFLIDGKTHYGWARLSVYANIDRCKVEAVLTGYAYETVAGKPIRTGKTSGADEVTIIEKHPDGTLGMLALGSLELVAWRRDEDAD
jgi:hypothetical protein